MTRYIDSHTDFPVSDAVFFAGNVLQVELTGIPEGEANPVPGGAAEQMREILRQLDHKLEQVGANKDEVVSAKVYLQDMADSAAVNAVYKEYFGDHSPTFGEYGVDLRPGLLVEAAFVASIPTYE